MTLKNEKLIAALKALGTTEEDMLVHVQRYIDDRVARADYHRKYNAKKNAVLKAVRAAHPELFAKAVGA